ncbi:sigma-70 family RNA polymerase sigma factor [Sanguibacter suaedae]|uniref:Sigma-70 family RNA polymerase sigma factor n=1 Tax=Sanguibacter suaedae TaxID=2795737 RepID=A0A934I5J2_9MICO|nr:sigma-70 family RNA polymerase sigma factor [Sanguibacter suaedae]MBI9115999.1 sigma-70 family RNA polymerase sigma factor [Sanguibacter suaedae]
MPDRDSDLTELVRTRHRALAGHAYLLCGNAREAEDLVQDALVKVFDSRKPPASGAAETYVRRAMLTIYLDGYRRRRRWSGIRHLVGASDRQEAADIASADQLDVAVALDALTPRQRACVVLRYYEDLTVAQVADRLGCASGTVKRHLFDAHAALRGLLGPFVEDDEPPPVAPRDPATPHRFAPAQPSTAPSRRLS